MAIIREAFATKVAEIEAAHQWLLGRGVNEVVLQRRRAGDLAYVNVSRHAGYTNVPKDGCFVKLLEPSDVEGYWIVELLGRCGYTVGAYVPGEKFTCAEGALKRTCLPSLDADADVNATRLYRTMLLGWPVAMDAYRAARCAAEQQAELRAEAQRRARILSSKFTRLNDATRAGYNQEWRTMVWASSGYTPAARPDFWKPGGIRGNLKAVGGRIADIARAAKACKTWNDAAKLCDVIVASLTTVSNPWRIASEKERQHLRRIELDLMDKWQLARTSCGHWYSRCDATSHVLLHGGVLLCAECAGRLVFHEAVTQTGVVVLTHPSYHSTYVWSDGVRRTYSEPPVIGGYHSSKSVVGELPAPGAGGRRYTGLKAGIELEFCNPARSKDDNLYARDMLNSVKHRAAELGLKLPNNVYGCFERDGSVDFEFVSGYGPLEVHRELLPALLAGAGTGLQSHNGGRCGLHVHLDKPKSLLHAQRLIQFWNSPLNERLVTAVARRYTAEGYAKVMPGAGATRDITRQYRSSKSYGDNTVAAKKQAISRTLGQLNSERYVLCNFSNPNTVEIRAFRGSLIPQTVLACIEMASLSWMFARDTPRESITTAAFLEYIGRPEWRHESRNLRRYLHERGFRVWAPRKWDRSSQAEA